MKALPLYLIYAIYTGTLALLTFILVPRKEIRRLGVYAVFFGAVTDVFNILLFTKVLGIGGYINFQPFGAFGIPFFPPIAWTAYFIIYLYMLPKETPWKYLFPAVAAGYSTFFSHVLQSMGIFKWSFGGPVFHSVIFFTWHYTVWWAYFRISGEKKAIPLPKHYFHVRQPALLKRLYRK